MVLFNIQAEGPFNLQAAEGIVANCLVTLNSSAKLAACAADGRPVGIIYRTVGADGWVAVEELRGIVQGIAGGAVNAGDLVKAGGAGSFVAETDPAVRTLVTIGVALETVAEGDPIHVLCSD